MDKDVINSAILSALSLLNKEIDVIEYEELKKEYQSIIDLLEDALNELKKHG